VAKTEVTVGVSGVADTGEDPRVCASKRVHEIKGVLALALPGWNGFPAVMPRCTVDGAPASLAQGAKVSLCPTRKACARAWVHDRRMRV
jgi:hypothetical protein